MVILLTNDDGITASGLQALKDELSKIGEVWVVAPDRERSAASHALTLRQPLRSKRIAEREISVEGTPTDCVILGVKGILGEKPDMVVSGLNHGPNLGADVFYSGTVAAAMEGTLLEIPSVAFSLAAKRDFEFGNVQICTHLIEFIRNHGLPQDTLLNINIPNLPMEEIRGARVTMLGKRIYKDTTSEEAGDDGSSSYSIGGELSWERKQGTDFSAIEEKMVSITPLHLDLTNYRVLKKLRRIEEDFRRIL
jgi:5'-nucleotidase